MGSTRVAQRAGTKVVSRASTIIPNEPNTIGIRLAIGRPAITLAAIRVPQKAMGTPTARASFPISVVPKLYPIMFDNG